jgi:LuxR family maltose regulon positive regulatory protein
LDVLRLLSEGYSNQEIAARMVVSLNTVKKHTSNLYGKLGVTSRTQAIALARQLGLIK